MAETDARSVPAAGGGLDSDAGPEPDPVGAGRGAVSRFVASFSVIGAVGALVFFLGSLTPSLIPRTWPYQALASGLSMICGYAVGTLVGWLFRTLGVRPAWRPRVRSFAWSLFAGVGLGSVVGVMVLSVRWQDELRELFGMPKVEPAYALVVLLAVALALVLLMLGRAVRWVVRRVGVFLDRWLPAVVAHVLAAVVVVSLLVLLVNGTLVSAAMDALNRAYSATDEGTPPGVTAPAAPQRSGSPDSQVAWDSLGRQGRVFVSGGPSQHDLLTFAAQRGLDQTVQAPIRVYAGLDSAADTLSTRDSARRLDAGADTPEAPEAETASELAAAAQLVVDELDRTDAWDREVLVVATTTGTGWVDPSMADSIELMYGGDTAIAAMQYSYLPSWIGFVVDRATPPAAGKALFEAVYEAWSQRPETQRPKLLTFGVSLGSAGGQSAFGGLQDMTTRTDGALWVGTPNFAENWLYLTRHRDHGSPEFHPVYQEGRQVRWGTGVGRADDLGDLASAWDEPRVAYVQHASDGVVWWSFDLLLHEPDWLREPKGPDVLSTLRWMPFVTFWQVTMDLFVAGDVPRGHGHNYVAEYADGWAAIAAPIGWADDDTDALAELIAERYDEAL